MTAVRDRRERRRTMRPCGRVRGTYLRTPDPASSFAHRDLQSRYAHKDSVALSDTTSRYSSLVPPRHGRTAQGDECPSTPPGLTGRRYHRRRARQRAPARPLLARRAVAVVQVHGRRAAAGAADPALLAAGEVRRGPGQRGAAGQRRAGGLRLLRGLRADRRHREVRHRAGHQVRDLRDHPHPRRDDRRTAGAGLDPALRAAEGAGRRARLRHAGGAAAAHPLRARGRRRDGHRAGGTARRSSASCRWRTWSPWRSCCTSAARAATGSA